MVGDLTHMNDQIPTRFAVTPKFKPFLFTIIVTLCSSQKGDTAKLSDPILGLSMHCTLSKLELVVVLGSLCFNYLIDHE